MMISNQKASSKSSVSNFNTSIVPSILYMQLSLRCFLLPSGLQGNMSQSMVRAKFRIQFQIKLNPLRLHRGTIKQIRFKKLDLRYLTLRRKSALKECAIQMIGKNKHQTLFINLWLIQLLTSPFKYLSPRIIMNNLRKNRSNKSRESRGVSSKKSSLKTNSHIYDNYSH